MLLRCRQQIPAPPPASMASFGVALGISCSGLPRLRGGGLGCHRSSRISDTTHPKWLTLIHLETLGDVPRYLFSFGGVGG